MATAFHNHIVTVRWADGVTEYVTDRNGGLVLTEQAGLAALMTGEAAARVTAALVVKGYPAANEYAWAVDPAEDDKDADGIEIGLVRLAG